jgi:polyphosphate kinase 2 (PPK2 family)
MAAYRAMLERTSTATAPWHVVPADRKWVRDAVVTEVLTQTLEGLDLKWPALTPEMRSLVIPE